jgi:hypothetical protein
MKAKRTKKKPEFPSFSIKIKIQSEEEARALYAIFNHAVPSRVFSEEACDAIKAAVGEEFYVTGNVVIGGGVTAHEFYR